MPVERDRLNRVKEMVEAHLLLDISSGPEAVFIFKEFRSWYTSTLERDISDSVGTAGGWARLMVDLGG